MTRRIKADLHLHSSCSDGALSPKAVIERAAAAGLNVVAITDHDTLDGVAEARQAGKRWDVEVIPGVEMSAYHGDEEFHVIGLYVGTTDPGFLEKLDTMRKARRDRIFEIVERLKEVGAELDAQEILDLVDSGSPTRAHVAEVLVKRGYATDVESAFSEYIGDSGPGFVPKKYMTVEETIAEIRNVGGVSILAHPGLTGGDMYIPLFAEMGMNGIEAFCPAYTRAQTSHYLGVAGRLGLLVSGGSDSHGKDKDKAVLGRIRVPGVFVEKIRAVAFLLPGSVGNQE